MKPYDSHEQTPVNREPAVAGIFYEANPERLRKQLNQCFTQANTTETKNNNEILALISPHAGYIFSGSVAAKAYSHINPGTTYRNVFLLGSSHRVTFNGVSVYNAGNYLTPLGEVPVNKALANKLIARNKNFMFYPKAHTNEHSLEVQLPFLQYRLKNTFQIVPIIIGTDDITVLEQLSDALYEYFGGDNLFIVSSDLSHFPAYELAQQVDTAITEAIEKNNPEYLHSEIAKHKKYRNKGLVTPMCGYTAAYTLLSITSRYKHLNIRLSEYKNSGDLPYGKRQKVVGYAAMVIEKDSGLRQNNLQASTNEAYSLNKNEKNELKKIARRSIALHLNISNQQYIPASLTTKLKHINGAFITITLKHKLRGCMGLFNPTKPLYQLIADIAKAAAFNDPRFTPLSSSEFDNIDIEISVLTPMRKIKNIQEIELGKHGIYITNGVQKGTFLPKVATETGWSLEELLGHCARDKAHMEWDGWKSAEIFIYEAYVF